MMADILWVGADQAYHSLADAVGASHAGDTINVEAGTTEGKATLVTNANVTVQNLEFSGASVDDGNGAGIRHESGALTVLNSYFHDNQEGILAGDNMASSMVVQ